MKYSHEIGITLVEFDNFIRFALRNLDTYETEAIKNYLSMNPEAGVVIPGGGGIRKLRWAAKGKGKRGGVRVIYYYHDLQMPLLLLTGFAKNELKDLNMADKNAMKKAIPSLIEQYRRPQNVH